MTLIPDKSFDASKASDLRGAFVTAHGPVWVSLKSVGNGKFEISIPESLHGRNYFVLNKGDSEVNDDTVVAGPATITVRLIALPSSDLRVCLLVGLDHG